MSCSIGSNIVCDDCGNKDDSINLHSMCQACKDIALFKQHPLGEDCPICFLTIPSLHTGYKYKPCCGKVICSGCMYAVNKMDREGKCPFCRVPVPESYEEIIESTKRRMEAGDAKAIRNLGCCYNEDPGRVYGIPQDQAKALELWHRAADLGSTKAYYNIGNAYLDGRGVERDMKMAVHYWELAALGGDAMARHNLGISENRAGNMNRALRHLMIAAGCGYDLSLKKIRELYVNGHATKDDYANALRAHQKYVDGIKSAQRDKAAAFNREKYRYY